jgi:serine/threonine protein phosphatase PrpC
MAASLQISAGQYSEAGRKDANQDFHGLVLPREPQLSGKGVAIALADGISSSEVSHLASQAAVTGFLQDYYATAEAWSVKTSAERVLRAINAWLHAQTRQSQYRYDNDRGYVCTFSAMVIKSTLAHIFHVGDARIWRVSERSLEPLTEDHRVWVARDQSYLARALGVGPQVEIDYRAEPVAAGDLFVLATDGVHEYVSPAFILEVLRPFRAAAAAGDATADALDAAARRIAREAHDRGSPDNLTVQIVRIDALPAPDAGEVYPQLAGLPFPPALEARMRFEGYTIVREVHASHRSQAFLALDEASREPVLIKLPSTELREDPAALERFLMEEWIARRLNSPHLMKAGPPARKRHFLYIATEFIEGQTLAQWMRDHPRADLTTVRDLVAQIARGLQAMHRLEMVHQDLRPENVMIDGTGTARIIDFGSTRVAGIAERAGPEARSPVLGTEQYAAPEYFLGEAGSSRSDIFSLATLAYQMLTGRLPYGADVPRARTPAAQRRLRYRPARDEAGALPAWVDEALRKALHPDPSRRYAELSEFVFDLHHPNRDFLSRHRTPLLARDPLRFWKALSLALGLIVLILVYRLHALA